MTDQRFAERVEQIHRELGIPEDYARSTLLILQPEPQELALCEPDYYGREQHLAPQALAAWHAMRDRAAVDGVTLFLISAFRSVEYQAQVIRRKVEAGRAIAEILCVNTAPGYSEHHTGRAVDIGTVDCSALEEVFETTPAFVWLQDHAAEFGFKLSYPRGNSCGISYEPWHWCFHADI